MPLIAHGFNPSFKSFGRKDVIWKETLKNTCHMSPAWRQKVPTERKVIFGTCRSRAFRFSLNIIARATLLIVPITI